MAMTDVVVEKKDHVAVVKIEHMKAMNALSTDMYSQLEEAFGQVAAMEDVYCVVLTGSSVINKKGKEVQSFVAGADISEMSKLTVEEGKQFGNNSNRVCWMIENFKRPVIAAINGFCLGGGVELSHVFFRYDDNSPYILNDLSLKIKPGEYVAIVGRTGCGKSTLMRLLLGFETPEMGAIYYDGKDIESLDLGSLRRKIGTVMQQSGLFQGDIYSNIVLTAPNLSMDEAWEAAEKAGIADDIRAMPMGMYTMVSEGGGGISGGQKQRLMIARAIAPKPKILIFDEATSALDNLTQKKVSDALDKLKCTRIVVAHRLSTIRQCDRIIVLDGGHIVEDGSYEKLMAQNGFFAELVARQRLDDEVEFKKTVF